MDYSIGAHNRKHRSSWVNICKALSGFSDISSSTHRILDKFGNHGKPFTRKIQRRRLWRVWSRTHWGCWIIPELCHLDIFTDIGTFLIWDPRSNRSSFIAGRPPSVPRCCQRYLGWFWSRKVGLISGKSRGRYFVSWIKLVESNIVRQQRLWMWT